MHDPSIPETGWYPDPADPETSLRLWDGESWTDKTSPRPRQSTGAVPGPALGQGATVPAANGTMASLEGQQQTPPSQQGVSPQAPSSDSAPATLVSVPTPRSGHPRLLPPRRLWAGARIWSTPDGPPINGAPMYGAPADGPPAYPYLGPTYKSPSATPSSIAKRILVAVWSASACFSWWRSWRPSRSHIPVRQSGLRRDRLVQRGRAWTAHRHRARNELDQ